MINWIEDLLLGVGLSWTMSKTLPYVLCIIIGIVVMLFLKKRMRTTSKLLKWIVGSIGLILPFVFYFSFHPIYEGDFSNNSISVDMENDLSELRGEKMVIISIANCPYCYESITRVKKLKERNPDINIEMRVCSSDSNSVNWYNEVAGENMNVVLAENKEALAKLAFGSFPTFVLVNNDSPLTVWSNDDFGVRAMDEVESRF